LRKERATMKEAAIGWIEWRSEFCLEVFNKFTHLFCPFIFSQNSFFLWKWKIYLFFILPCLNK
jgi:hypothetical protein